MRTNKMHTFPYNYNYIVIRINFYTCLASLAHPQGVHICIKKPVSYYYPLQYVELLFIFLCVSYRVGYVH